MGWRRGGEALRGSCKGVRGEGGRGCKGLRGGGGLQGVASVCKCLQGGFKVWQKGCGKRGVAKGVWQKGCGKRGVAKGVWQKGCGKIGVAKGVWQKGCGKWGVANGVWQMGCGKWGVANGVWQKGSHLMFKPAIACASSVRSSLVFFFVCSSLQRSEMRRRGWQTVEMPAGWFEVIRCRRPKSESWVKRERKGPVPQPDRGGGRQPRRNGPPPSVPTGGSERRTPEEAFRAARARVAKLEAAISVVGESDPTFRQARKHAQAQPAESQIKSLEFFIERARKRVENARMEVEDAKAKVVAAEITLTSEGRALQDGEQRHASFLAERVSEEPPPTIPVDYAAK